MIVTTVTRCARVVQLNNSVATSSLPEASCASSASPGAWRAHKEADVGERADHCQGAKCCKSDTQCRVRREGLEFRALPNLRESEGVCGASPHRGAGDHENGTEHGNDDPVRVRMR